MEMIRTDHLMKKYQKNNQVGPVSVTVEEGALYTLIGAKNSGKSTVLNMLADITVPTGGDTFLFAEKGAFQSVKNSVGILPADPGFYEDYTPVKQLQFFSRISGAKADKNRIHKVLDAVGLGDVKKVRTGRLLPAQKRRLGLAQAIIHDPVLILLDEPTAGLNERDRTDVRKMIEQWHEAGKTIVMTTDNLEEAEALSTHLAVMHEGSVVVEGSLAELKQRFASSFSVKMKLSSEMSQYEHRKIEEALTLLNKSEERDGRYLTVHVASEEEIPKVLMVFLSNNVKIYEVTVRQDSLSDVFEGGLPYESTDETPTRAT
ncbi:ABC transporter ATP-binding protein [Salisediminibacterium halotolerans]|uniref:ABC-2 type transport system ATP-binding protein n=1 Tax=Salisediminibacterium halotolerans TaxID=517425 RepID=A0A1H9VYZ6_9BACI|nr:ABC transporter ATP-binding protein [Salisediminibacterium haloalkalitolerans]SES26862.1 ABC-2 type transport system ATP-binding protein [Salisediminibacterium haloalkalitolerans]